MNLVHNKEMLVSTVQITLLKTQLDFYGAYESAIATTMSLGFSEEESKEIVDQAVKENQEEISKEFDVKGLRAELVESATKRKSVIDSLLGIR